MALVIIIFGLLMTLSESRTSQRAVFGNDVFHGSTMETALRPFARNRPFTHTHTHTHTRLLNVHILLSVDKSQCTLRQIRLFLL
jgi:hypothetical protein